MPMYPTVRKEPSGYIIFDCTARAECVARALKRKQKALTKEQVHQAAVTLAKERRIQDPDEFTLLGLYRIQFGQYQGQTFHWIAENAIGYASHLLCQIDSEGGNTGNSPLNDNKRDLRAYILGFPDGRAAYAQRKAEWKKKRELNKKKAAPTTAASLVNSRLSAEEVARRLSQPSPAKKPAPAIPSTSAARPLQEGEIEDGELLTQVNALEASQPATAKDQPEMTEAMETSPPTATTTPTARPLSQLRSLSTKTLQEPDLFPLPQGWKTTLPEEDKKWVSKALIRFNAQGKLEVRPTQLWYHPPQPALIPSEIPFVDRYFAHSLLVWMPRRLWRVRLYCTNSKCEKYELTGAGTYHLVRQVLGLTDYYNMVTEKLECLKCMAKYIAWSGGIVNQLDVSRRRQFPVLLTYRYACDESVVTLLRSRGLGNSSHQMQRKLEEQHSKRWLTQAAHYLADCKGFANSKLVVSGAIAGPPTRIPTPKYRWLQTVYCIDVMNRIDEVKADITSTFGTILKMDSTKKVAKKLAGHSQGTATWATNVGNEDGQVLMSVLTCQEGIGGLCPMVDGIVKRYADASVDPPRILYVDRDCCGDSPTSKLFRAWPDLLIRLDIWHFMRRFTAGCSTDSHQLYSVFMARLSKCIFVWSTEDLQNLRDAKRSELLQKNVPDPSADDILRWLKKNELALHCRRQTRGTEETTQLLGDLLEAFMGDQGLDTLGVPLFDNEKMMDIWESQKRHIACIQDPEGIDLYAQVGTLKKGTEVLPKYRCARGSVSLESFHNHLAKFIPGTTTSDVHYQAYLLDGLQRWNEDRVRQASKPSTASYSGLLRHAVNDLSQAVLKRDLVPEYRAPRKYTGEKIGVEYLYSQTNKVLQDFILGPDNEDLARFEPEADTGTDEDEDEDQDEGFEDATEADDPTIPPADANRLSVQPAEGETVPTQPERPTLPTTPPRGDQPDERGEPGAAVGPDNIGGYEAVEQLATYLYTMRDQSHPLANVQATMLVGLWDKLSEFDSQPTVPSPRHKTRLTKGSVTTFKVRSKPSCVPGVDSVKRAFHGTEGGVAQRPDSNRYMELLIVKLCHAFPSPVKQAGKRIDRWSQIVKAYRNIRELIVSNPRVMEGTSITLYAINNATLQQWYNKRTRDQERRMLEQNIRLAEPPMATSLPLPPSRVQVPVSQAIVVPPEEQHEFVLPPYTVGTSKKVRKRLFTPAETPANPEAHLRMTPLPVPIFPQPPPVTRVLQVPIYSGPICSTSQDLSKTTLWYRKQQDKKKAAGEYVRRYQVQRQARTYTCHKCGKLRTKETHQQYYGHWFCPATASESYDEWRSSREKCRREKKLLQQQQKQQQQQADPSSSDTDSY